MLTQTAPYPHELADLVKRCRYRAHEGWSVRLYDDYPRDQDPAGETIGHGMTLVIYTRGYDSYHPDEGRNYGVNHIFIVPAATFNRQAWMEWLHQRFRDVEAHECNEHFIITDDEGREHRPFAPLHGPGDSPYVTHYPATDTQRGTAFNDYTHFETP